MNAFQYANPVTRVQAISLLSGHPGEAAILAGGTDLLSLMKDGIATPKVVVNIKSILDLGGIEKSKEQTLRIGPLVTLKQLMVHPEIKSSFPSLVQAARGVRSSQIQSVGTVGGDLCQRPRCWYYRNGFGLLPTQNGQSMVVAGDNRYHAILGTSGGAYFVSPSSLAPALIALQATLKIQGPEGEREVPLEKFYRTPSSSTAREFDLTPQEIVTSILIPLSAQTRNATYEVRQKEALDWPLAAAAVAIEMTGGDVKAARVVLGHVAPTPWNAPAAAEFLRGKKLDEGVAEEAGKRAVEGAKPLSRNSYKVQLARVAVKRALLRAAGREV